MVKVPTVPSGCSRHARLAVNAGMTWCTVMLDTLADTDAPWRTRGEYPADGLHEYRDGTDGSGLADVLDVERRLAPCR